VFEKWIYVDPALFFRELISSCGMMFICKNENKKQEGGAHLLRAGYLLNSSYGTVGFYII